MTLSDTRSIVAVDPTTRGLAFVFFEGGRLMDWGERSARDDRDALHVVDDLVEDCAANVLVLEDAGADGCRRRARMRRMLRAIARYARRRGFRVREVARLDVRKAWAARGVTNKEATASAIASAFAELEPLVPLKRRTGGSEDPRGNIFDAASLAIYFSEPSRVIP